MMETDLLPIKPDEIGHSNLLGFTFERLVKSVSIQEFIERCWEEEQLPEKRRDKHGEVQQRQSKQPAEAILG